MTTMCTDYTTADRTTGTTRAAGRGLSAAGLGLSYVASRVLAGVKHVALWPVRVNAARRELEMLSRMTAYELKDIGLTSSDLADATALPADASPTDFLAARVEERHRARFA